MCFGEPCVGSGQRDPKPEDDSLLWKDPSTYKGSHSASAALFSDRGVLFGLGSLCLLPIAAMLLQTNSSQTGNLERPVDFC